MPLPGMQLLDKFLAQKKQESNGRTETTEQLIPYRDPAQDPWKFQLFDFHKPSLPTERDSNLRGAVDDNRPPLSPVRDPSLINPQEHANQNQGPPHYCEHGYEVPQPGNISSAAMSHIMSHTDSSGWVRFSGRPGRFKILGNTSHIHHGRSTHHKGHTVRIHIHQGCHVGHTHRHVHHVCHRVGPNAIAAQFSAPIQDGRINDESTIDAANALYAIANAQPPADPVVEPEEPPVIAPPKAVKKRRPRRTQEQIAADKAADLKRKQDAALKKQKAKDALKQKQDAIAAEKAAALMRKQAAKQQIQEQIAAENAAALKKKQEKQDAAQKKQEAKIRKNLTLPIFALATPKEASAVVQPGTQLDETMVDDQPLNPSTKVAKPEETNKAPVTTGTLAAGPGNSNEASQATKPPVATKDKREHKPRAEKSGRQLMLEQQKKHREAELASKANQAKLTPLQEQTPSTLLTPLMTSLPPICHLTPEIAGNALQAFEACTPSTSAALTKQPELQPAEEQNPRKEKTTSDIAANSPQIILPFRSKFESRNFTQLVNISQSQREKDEAQTKLDFKSTAGSKQDRIATKSVAITRPSVQEKVQVEQVVKSTAYSNAEPSTPKSSANARPSVQEKIQAEQESNNTTESKTDPTRSASARRPTSTVVSVESSKKLEISGPERRRRESATHNRSRSPPARINEYRERRERSRSPHKLETSGPQRRRRESATHNRSRSPPARINEYRERRERSRSPHKLETSGPQRRRRESATHNRSRSPPARTNEYRERRERSRSPNRAPPRDRDYRGRSPLPRDSNNPRPRHSLPHRLEPSRHELDSYRPGAEPPRKAVNIFQPPGFAQVMSRQKAKDGRLSGTSPEPTRQPRMEESSSDERQRERHQLNSSASVRPDLMAAPTERFSGNRSTVDSSRPTRRDESVERKRGRSPVSSRCGRDSREYAEDRRRSRSPGPPTARGRPPKDYDSWRPSPTYYARHHTDDSRRPTHGYHPEPIARSARPFVTPEDSYEDGSHPDLTRSHGRHNSSPDLRPVIDWSQDNTYYSRVSVRDQRTFGADDRRAADPIRSYNARSPELCYEERTPARDRADRDRIDRDRADRDRADRSQTDRSQNDRQQTDRSRDQVPKKDGADERGRR